MKFPPSFVVQRNLNTTKRPKLVRSAAVRRFPYSIFFRTRSDRLIVLSVFHARRAPGIWRERV
jgi:hypothetical protein